MLMGKFLCVQPIITVIISTNLIRETCQITVRMTYVRSVDQMDFSQIFYYSGPMD